MEGRKGGKGGGEGKGLTFEPVGRTGPGQTPGSIVAVPGCPLRARQRCVSHVTDFPQEDMHRRARGRRERAKKEGLRSSSGCIFRRRGENRSIAPLPGNSSCGGSGGKW